MLYSMYINLFGLICQSFSGNFFYIFDDNTKTPCTSTERFAKMYVVRSSPQWRNRNRWIRTTSMLIHESAVLPLNYIPKLLPGCRLALAACCKKEPRRLCAFGFYCIVQRTFRIIRTFFLKKWRSHKDRRSVTYSSLILPSVLPVRSEKS